MSLHTRLLLAASLVLTAFLGATGLALDRAYQTSSKTAMQQRLLGHIYALLSAADEGGHGLEMPEFLSDPRFNQPGSGFYALVEGDGLHWQSLSLTGYPGRFLQPTTPGDRHFFRKDFLQGEIFALNYGITWETEEGVEKRYTLAVAEDTMPLRSQLTDFRLTLWRWLGGLALGLLLVQGAVLRWGLLPIRHAAADLREVESGNKTRLDSHYPRELLPLTVNINSLIEHSSRQQERYRNSLDDLAHSLKTPLAVLRTAMEEDQSGKEGSSETSREQIKRMDDIVRHQLARAAGSTRAAVMPAFELRPLADRIVRSLEKVYREKGVRPYVEISEDLLIRGDEGDLMELLGNLLDNAWKHCIYQVQLQALVGEESLTLIIEDDGPGIPKEEAEKVLQRGGRADQHSAGQGIGLTVANDIVRTYGGSLQIETSALGGTAIRIHLPQAYVG